MTEKQKHVLKVIGKGAFYTTITAGAYLLAKGALSIILRKLAKAQAKPKAPYEKAESTAEQSPSVTKKSKTRSATP